MKSLLEEMGGTYRQEGDYLIPNLVLPDTDDYQIGKYGRMRNYHNAGGFIQAKPTGAEQARVPHRSWVNLEND